MCSKVKCRVGLLSILGLCLVVLGYGLTMCVDDMFQYILPISAVEPGNNDNLKMYYEADERIQSLRESLPVYTIAGRAQNLTVRGEGGQSTETTLYAVGKGYFELYHEHLLRGRLISETDVNKGKNVVVLDDEAELVLFKGDSALEKTVYIDGIEMQVVGIIDGKRRLGEAGEHLVYVPITSLYKNGIKTDTMEITAIGVDNTSSPVIMENTLKNWSSSGSFYNLSKLKMGATLPVRWIIVFLGIKTLLVLAERANRWVAKQIEMFRNELQRCYFLQILGRVIWKMIVALIAYCILAMGMFGIVRIAVQPMYVFGEWIPESIVELTSIVDCIWNQIETKSVSIECASRLSVCLDIAEELIKWGVILVFLGCANLNCITHNYVNRNVEVCSF